MVKNLPISSSIYIRAEIPDIMLDHTWETEDEDTHMHKAYKYLNIYMCTKVTKIHA